MTLQSSVMNESSVSSCAHLLVEAHDRELQSERSWPLDLTVSYFLAVLQ